MSWAERLRPRSNEGDVFRDEWVEQFEILVDCMGARLVFFRPHLVVGDDLLVLSGVFGARRVALTEVRTAVASEGSLKLKLIGGDEVYVPGHFLWGHARCDCYAYLAAVVNRRLEGRAPDEFE